MSFGQPTAVPTPAPFVDTDTWKIVYDRPVSAGGTLLLDTTEGGIILQGDAGAAVTPMFQVKTNGGTNILSVDNAGTIAVGAYSIIFEGADGHTVGILQNPNAATAGGPLTLLAGDGGVASAGAAGGRGGDAQLLAGFGGSGSAARVPGVGADCVITAGDSGPLNGNATGAAGGNVLLNAGAKTASGTNGAVVISVAGTEGLRVNASQNTVIASGKELQSDHLTLRSTTADTQTAMIFKTTNLITGNKVFQFLSGATELFSFVVNGSTQSSILAGSANGIRIFSVNGHAKLGLDEDTGQHAVLAVDSTILTLSSPGASTASVSVVNAGSDVAANPALLVNTSGARTTAPSLSLQNNSVEQLGVDANGNIAFVKQKNHTIAVTTTTTTATVGGSLTISSATGGVDNGGSGGGNGGAFVINSGAGGAGNGQNSGAGGATTVQSGAGGAASSTDTAGAGNGGAATFKGGTGGAGNNTAVQDAGAGGAVIVQGGTGGAGAAAIHAGAGGAVTVQGGTAGTTSVTNAVSGGAASILGGNSANGNGGNVILDGGTAAGGGTTAGSVSLAPTNASSFVLGRGAIGIIDTLGTFGVRVYGKTDDGATAVGVTFSSATAKTGTAGQAVSAFQNDPSSASDALYVGAMSADGGVLCYAELLIASAAISVGQVVVWSGTKKVAKAAATAGLTTIAGVALTAAAGNGNTLKVARRGRCLVLADAGIVAGDQVATSGATAGNVATPAVPALGGVVGRATEATAGTTAGMVEVDITLS